MKYKNIVTLTIALILIAGNYVFSQNCNFAIKDSSKVTVNAQTFTNPSLSDPKFNKLKEDKQTEAITKYNASVVAGTILPASTYPMTFSVKKTTLAEGGDEYSLTMNIAGKDYSSYSICKDDTLYIIRNKDLVDIPDGKGGSLGFIIQGPQKLPLKLSVGTKIPVYDDIYFLYPSTYNNTAKKIGVTKGSSTSRGVWTSMDVKVKETVTYSSRTIHYMFAEVTGTEEVTVSGVKYNAYIIESQTWTKGNMTMTFQADDEEVQKQMNKSTAKGLDKFDKMMIKKHSTNELGYMVSYLKEWYVPEVGTVVKTESYDNLGGIASRIMLTGIE